MHLIICKAYQMESGNTVLPYDNSTCYMGIPRIYNWDTLRYVEVR